MSGCGAAGFSGPSVSPSPLSCFLTILPEPPHPPFLQDSLQNAPCLWQVPPGLRPSSRSFALRRRAGDGAEHTGPRGSTSYHDIIVAIHHERGPASKVDVLFPPVTHLWVGGRLGLGQRAGCGQPGHARGKSKPRKGTHIVSCPPRLEYQVLLQPGGKLVLEFLGQCLHAVILLVIQQGPDRLQVLSSQVTINVGARQRWLPLSQPCSDPSPTTLKSPMKGTVLHGWTSPESSLPCPPGYPDPGPHPLNCGWHAGHRKLGQGRLEAVEHGPPAGQKADTGLRVQSRVLGWEPETRMGANQQTPEELGPKLSEPGQTHVPGTSGPCLSQLSTPNEAPRVSNQMPKALHQLLLTAQTLVRRLVRPCISNIQPW